MNEISFSVYVQNRVEGTMAWIKNKIHMVIALRVAEVFIWLESCGKALSCLFWPPSERQKNTILPLFIRSIMFAS
jgi:hypothetical protein